MHVLVYGVRVSIMCMRFVCVFRQLQVYSIRSTLGIVNNFDLEIPSPSCF